VLVLGVGAVACGPAREAQPAPVPVPIGRGPGFLPRALGTGPAPPLPCTSGPASGPLRAHLELFARRRAIVVPAGIGVRRACRYPLRTLAPTGVIELDGPGLTLGDFFTVWRMPLSPTRLLGFRGPVTAYVAGRRWDERAGEIPLDDGAQVVVELGGYVRPHPSYLFPPR
jgi:hypothetical protein